MSSQSVHTAALTPPRQLPDGASAESAAASEEKEIRLDESSSALDDVTQVPLPAYLQQVYWWAYLHPAAVRIFERQWLVNLIPVSYTHLDVYKRQAMASGVY